MSGAWDMDPYNERVRALFAQPAHAGQLADGVVVRNADQGIRVELSAQATDGQLTRIRFRLRGCPHSIAACEASCAELEDTAIQSAAGFTVAKLMQSLAVPAEKSARILVIEDTVRLLGAALQESATSGR